MKQIETVLRQISLACALITAGIGGIALTAWMLGNVIIASLSYSYIPMAPSTAVFFIILGIALFNYIRRPEHFFWSRFAKSAALLTLTGAGVILFGFFAGIKFKAEHLLFEQPEVFFNFPVGHMSPITAVCFITSALALLFLADKRAQKNTASIFAVITALTGAVLILGYLYGTPILYGGSLIPVALTTSFAFLFLGMGLLTSAGPDSYPLKLFIGTSFRARLMKILLPIITAFILIHGWLDTIVFPYMKNPVLTASATAILSFFIISVIISKLAKTVGGRIDRLNAERDEAEVNLRKNEELFRLLAENASDLIYRMSLPGGRYEYVSPSSERLFGYTPEEFYDAPLLIRRVLHPDWLEYFEEKWTRLLAGDIPPFYEYQIIHKSGGIRWMYQRNALIKDDKGLPAAIEGIVTDITERKQAEAALQESERQYRTLVDNALIGVFKSNFKGDFIYANKALARIFEYDTVDDMIPGGVLTRYENPEDREALMKALMKNGSVANYEVKLFTKTGKARHLLINANLEKDVISGMAVDVTEVKEAEKEILRLNTELEKRVIERTADLNKTQRALVNIVEDLGQKKKELEQANESLKEMDRLKSMFIATMSHELRTPLNSIIGFSSILHDEWLGPLNDEQKMNLFSILKSGRHLLELINDILDLSKIEAGKIEIHLEDFDIDSVITEAVDLLKKDAGEKGLTLEVESVHQRMHTDRRRFLQCVVNLLSNAVKFTGKGLIKIEVKKMRSYDADFIEISVKDTGIGIKTEDLPKLFQPFVRLHEMNGIPGTGLGLYLTKKILTEILKGDIMVSSEYRKGTRVVMKIPV